MFMNRLTVFLSKVSVVISEYYKQGEKGKKKKQKTDKLPVLPVLYTGQKFLWRSGCSKT